MLVPSDAFVGRYGKDNERHFALEGDVIYSGVPFSCLHEVQCSKWIDACALLASSVALPALHYPLNHQGNQN